MAAGSILAAAAAAERQAMETADEAWARYANAKGLTFKRSQIEVMSGQPTRLSGKHEGVSIACEVAQIDGEWGITAIAVPPAPISVRLEFAPEGVLAKIGKLFGAQDIVLGEPAFDSTYLVKATHADKAKAVLVPATRTAMLELGVRTFHYDDGSTSEKGAVLIAGIPAVLATDADLDRMLAFLVAVAKIHP